MSEFTDKVEQYKQVIRDKVVEPGFTTGDELPDISGESGITDIPNINIENDSSQEDHQEEHQESSQDEDKGLKEIRRVEGLKKRLKDVTYEKKIRESQTRDLMAKLQEQERRLAEQQAMLEQSEQYKNTYYENNLQTRETAILNELKVAKEEGDVDREIALSKELAKVAADQSTYGLYKSQMRNQPPAYEPHPTYNDPNIYPEPNFGNGLRPQEDNYDYEEPVNEAYENWLYKNSWADPASRNFSPHLREEANKLANELDDMLRYNGDADVIGTPSYFASIDEAMSQRYGIKKQERTPVSREPQNSSYSVAPVSRSGSSMADQYMRRNPNSTRNSVQLTEEEYKIARNLQIKMPDGTWRSGPEAMRRYMEGKKIPLEKPGSHKLSINDY
jgi:hypothetical protein